MLAGLRGGDWNAATLAPSEGDYNKASDHASAVIKYWPNSPEALYFNEQIESAKRTNSPTFELPLGHEVVASIDGQFLADAFGN